jgi:hypothetical protein
VCGGGGGDGDREHLQQMMNSGAGWLHHNDSRSVGCGEGWCRAAIGEGVGHSAALAAEVERRGGVIAAQEKQVRVWEGPGVGMIGQVASAGQEDQSGGVVTATHVEAGAVMGGVWGRVIAGFG